MAKPKTRDVLFDPMLKSLVTRVQMEADSSMYSRFFRSLKTPAHRAMGEITPGLDPSQYQIISMTVRATLGWSICSSDR